MAQHSSVQQEMPRNEKKYLLATLFNAPSTADASIRAEVNHDMASPDLN